MAFSGSILYSCRASFKARLSVASVAFGLSVTTIATLSEPSVPLSLAMRVDILGGLRLGGLRLTCARAFVRARRFWRLGAKDNFCGHNCERGLVRDAGGRQVLHVCRRSAALCLGSYLWHAFSARWEINQGGHFAFGTHVAASKNLQKASGRCPGVFKCAVGFLPALLGFFL